MPEICTYTLKVCWPCVLTCCMEAATRVGVTNGCESCSLETGKKGDLQMTIGNSHLHEKRLHVLQQVSQLEDM